MIILSLESLEWCQVLMRTKTPVDNQLYYTMLPLYYQHFKGNAHPFQIYTTLQHYYNKYISMIKSPGSPKPRTLFPTIFFLRTSAKLDFITKVFIFRNFLTVILFITFATDFQMFHSIQYQNCEQSLYILTDGLFSLFNVSIWPKSFLYAESTSAWSNQGSVMCLLSILNQ